MGPLYTTELVARQVIPLSVLRIESFFLCQLDISSASRVWTADPDVRLATDEEIESFRGGRNLPTHSDPARRPKMFVIDCEKRMIAAIWLQPVNLVMWGGLEFKLAATDIQGCNLWADPNFRGKNLGPRLNRHAAVVCSQLGYKRVISTVNTLNRNALRADEKVGYEKLCRFFAVRVFGLIALHADRPLEGRRWRFGRHIEVSLRDLA